MICKTIMKDADGRTVPQIIVGDATAVPIHVTLRDPTGTGNLPMDVNLDYAILTVDNNQGAIGTYQFQQTPMLIPIPVCPNQALPRPSMDYLSTYYGNVGVFQQSDMCALSIWKDMAAIVHQYSTPSHAGAPVDCIINVQTGLCRGASGGVYVHNGFAAAMNLVTVNHYTGKRFESLKTARFKGGHHHTTRFRSSESKVSSYPCNNSRYATQH
jgi:hypothetical protein